MSVVALASTKKVNDQIWLDVEHWITEKSNYFSEISMIGSGGNINKIIKFGDNQIYWFLRDRLPL